jgi:hypothetical protein
MVLAHCSNLKEGHTTHTRHTRLVAAYAAGSFATANFLRDSAALQPARAQTIPNSLGEIGRQNKIFREVFASRHAAVCATQRIRFIRKRLDLTARKLRCAFFDAAMHYRKPGTAREPNPILESTGHGMMAARQRNLSGGIFERFLSVATKRRFVLSTSSMNF